MSTQPRMRGWGPHYHVEADVDWCTLSRLIPLTLSVSRNLTLINLALSRSMDSLLCDRIAPTLGLAFSPNDAQSSSGGVIIFIRQGLSFSKLSTSLSSLDPYYDYVGVNFSLNKSSSLSFLKVFVFPICFSSTFSTTDCFSPFILFSFRNLFIVGDFNCHKPCETQKVLLTPVERKCWIESSPPTSLPSMNLTYLLFSIAPQAVDLLLTSPLLLPLSPTLASGRCFTTWVLITYQICWPFFFLRPFAPTNVHLPSIFRKLVGMTLLLASTLTVLLHKNARLFFFLLLMLSSLLWH